MIPIQQQLAAITTTSSESFTLILLILGALFAMVGSSYFFTWRVLVDAREGRDDLWAAIKEIYKNDLEHIQARLTELEIENEKMRGGGTGQ